MKRAIGILAGAVLLGTLLSALAAAAPARPEEYFTISSYDVDVTVSAGQVCDVSETIRV